MLRFFLALPFAVSLILCQLAPSQHAMAQDAYQNALDALDKADKADKIHANKQETGALNNPFADKSILNAPILFIENIHAILQQVMNAEKLSVEEVLHWDQRCASRDIPEEDVKIGMASSIQCKFWEPDDGSLIAAHIGLDGEGRPIVFLMGAAIVDGTEEFHNAIVRVTENFNATYGSNHQIIKDNGLVWKGKPGFSVLTHPVFGKVSGFDAGIVRDDYLPLLR
jgi:hypothetical protein